MKKRLETRNSRCRQAGVSLLEVLISVLVLAIGILGIAALQAITLKNAGSAASRTQASMQVYSMFDIIRGNRGNIGGFNTNTYTAGGGSGTAGTMEGWLDSLQTTIAPDARGRVVCDAGTQICEVGVRWSDERATGGSQTQEIVVRSRI
ncbi:type IV pilus modification protein PilV [Lysobacter soyae]|uniref:Type IV pilus modification protein PilV n=1 Tax=Lysobacter soyae TaxID=2764185 RepID=A0ABX8WNT5_9GAMM|nr:type IV pilus modification protein PilV [Lysobacter sp. CJ11]QYR52536.1 type IV pilus modification protein PilV [Lysobacter sp. CJ11]